MVKIEIEEVPRENAVYHAMRACLVAQASGTPVVMIRSGISVVVFPESHYVDIRRLFVSGYHMVYGKDYVESEYGNAFIRNSDEQGT